jgi:AhpD family alkylhydroperoxidase
MKNIQVFDPALCCSSGVCGADVDQKLVDFSADVDWAKQQGAQIERFNLAQQPMAFVDNVLVKNLLQQQGEAALPVLLVDGKVRLSGSYPSRDMLAGWLGVQLEVSIFTSQVAELVAIGAAIASNCEPCFKYHFDAARQLGVSSADMLKAVELAQKVKDSPAQAVWELAQRYLNPAASAATSDSSKGSACCGSAAPEGHAKVQSGCCGGSNTEAGKPATKCC